MDIRTNQIKVEIKTVLGETKISFSELADWQKGNLIKLNRGNENSVCLKVGDVIIAYGELRKHNDKLEVEIKEKL